MVCYIVAVYDWLNCGIKEREFSSLEKAQAYYDKQHLPTWLMEFNGKEMKHICHKNQPEMPWKGENE